MRVCLENYNLNKSFTKTNKTQLAQKWHTSSDSDS